MVYAFYAQVALGHPPAGVLGTPGVCHIALIGVDCVLVQGCGHGEGVAPCVGHGCRVDRVGRIGKLLLVSSETREAIPIRWCSMYRRATLGGGGVVVPQLLQGDATCPTSIMYSGLVRPLHAATMASFSDSTFVRNLRC